MISQEQLSIIPFGGRGEIGNNMIALQYKDSIIILDCGIMFPTENMLGIDIVTPDISYLVEQKEKIKAVLISHGHEDHIGAIPFLLKKIQVPIYGTKLTLEMVKKKLTTPELIEKTDLREVSVKEKINLNPFKIKFIRVNHSIPGAIAMAIHTPVGNVLYTGDFKFDQTPINGKPTDFNSLTNFGKQGVLALLSDSTNAERSGYSISERVVEKTINNIFDNSEGRIIVATFSSHLDRVQQVINAAYKTNRKIAISGRSMIENTELAKKLGYLKFPEKNILLPVRKINNLSNNKIIYLMTGSQGETMASLSRIARGEHREITLQKGDTVLLSATPIPGNEKSVGNIINQLFEKGAQVIYGKELDVHVSGHACQEELKLMLNMIQPKYFIPVHGEYRHLYHHGLLAKQVGISDENIFITKNGDKLNINPTSASLEKNISTGKILIDGLGSVNKNIIKDRKSLAENGILIIIITINNVSKQIIAENNIISKGFANLDKSKNIIKKINTKINKILKEYENENINDLSSLKYQIKKELKSFIYNKTKRSPMIIPAITSVTNKK